MTASRCGFVLVSLAVVLALILGCRVTEVPVRPPATEDPAAPAPEAIMRRIRAKDQVVENLAHGRCSLLHAAALFRELNRIPPETKYPVVPAPDSPLRLESPTEEERHCLAVIIYARNTLRVTHPGWAEAVTERLVAEFWAERCERGEIRLPEASPESVQELLDSGP